MNKLSYITTNKDKKPSNIPINKQIPISTAEKLTKEEVERLNKNTELLNKLKRELEKEQK